ncbi:expressed unknown protein [Seminavis robusta]|uniref:Uncharacterized protein n=1 Tax=Seminavis robusta TaxID=568900 RepID=A0A9N8DZ64_9STRA|nr:expressed unknown protein [Seminavis robusta]|eukprot:Sro357_g125660.1 n/a (818) ;mRNA; r:37076-39529
MSWFKQVNNLLEKLDDQVENVRDVLVEQQEDYFGTDESDDEDDEESGDEEDEDEDDDDDLEEEEEEIDLMTPEETQGQESLFPQTPTALEATATTPIAKPPAVPPPAVQPTEPTSNTGDPSKASPASSTKKQDTVVPADTKAKQLATPKQPSAVAKQQPASPAVTQMIPSTKQSADLTQKTPTPTSSKTVAKAAEKTPPPKQQPSPAKKSQPSPAGKATASTQSKPAPKNPEQPLPKSKAPPPPPKPQQVPSKKQPQPQQPRPPPKKAPGSSGSVNTNNKQQVLAEMRQLRKQVLSLQQELNAANKEIKAQQKELNSAATIVERERQELKEEKEDMKEDFEEEMENLKMAHQDTIANLKAAHKKQLLAVQEQLSHERAERQQEGGDLSQDLEETLQRERDALKQVVTLKEAKANLEGRVEKLTMQQESLQEKLDTALDAQKTAAERQQQAEHSLDDTLEQHKRQLKQRQIREAELERTIAEMGAALTVASSAANTTTAVPANGSGVPASFPEEDDKAAAALFKEKWEVAVEELETTKTQLRLESQRSEALRRELGEMNQERTLEAKTYQERQREYDQKLAEQSSTISRLEKTIHDLNLDDVPGANNEDTPSTATVQRLQRQLEECKTQTKRLSEQLLRQQGMSDVHKSEIMALKGRLKAANARADEAEKTAFQPPADNTRNYESEGGGGYGGGFQMRRRVKGRGYGGRNSVTVRSIRAALNMGPGSSMEDLGKTIDAVDSWMIDTGTVLRHEPLARLALLCYFVLIHLWCFGLVAFHVSEPSAAVGPMAMGHHGGGLRSALRGAAANPGAALETGNN